MGHVCKADDRLMKTAKVKLTGARETLLITLFAKAGEADLPDSVLKDRMAAEAVARIDYDFAKLKVTRDIMVGLAMRARKFDEYVRAFIARNPDAMVLNLGCGLDTRAFRVEWPSTVQWFDVDFPEVIALRQQLYPQKSGYRMIGSSVTESAWLEDLPAQAMTIVVAEGLLMYLTRHQVRQLFTDITGRVRGGEAVFDAGTRLGTKLVQRQRSLRSTGATLHWWINDPHELEEMVPRMRFVEEVPAYDRAMLKRFSWPSRVSVQFMLMIPPLRKMGRFLRYVF